MNQGGKKSPTPNEPWTKKEPTPNEPNVHFPNFINSFVTKIPTVAAQIVENHTAKMILQGLLEFKELLIAITVVGII